MYERSRSAQSVAIIGLRLPDARVRRVGQISAENRRYEGIMTDDRLLRCCELIGTSTWSDALDELAIEGVVNGISQRRGRGRFAAYAVTTREVSGPFRAYERTQFAVGSLIASVGPGLALVVDAGARRSRPSAGSRRWPRACAVWRRS
jgi:hypothetical protein